MEVHGNSTFPEKIGELDKFDLLVNVAFREFSKISWKFRNILPSKIKLRVSVFSNVKFGAKCNLKILNGMGVSDSRRGLKAKNKLNSCHLSQTNGLFVTAVTTNMFIAD